MFLYLSADFVILFFVCFCIATIAISFNCLYNCAGVGGGYGGPGARGGRGRGVRFDPYLPFGNGSQYVY